MPSLGGFLRCSLCTETCTGGDHQPKTLQAFGEGLRRKLESLVRRALTYAAHVNAGSPRRRPQPRWGRCKAHNETSENGDKRLTRREVAAARAPRCEPLELSQVELEDNRDRRSIAFKSPRDTVGTAIVVEDAFLFIRAGIGLEPATLAAILLSVVAINHDAMPVCWDAGAVDGRGVRLEPT
jgi:hypothetical protein